MSTDRHMVLTFVSDKPTKGVTFTVSAETFTDAIGAIYVSRAEFTIDDGGEAQSIVLPRNSLTTLVKILGGLV